MNLLEHQGKRLLGDAGIAVPRGRVAGSPAAAVDAAAHLGTRVVLKSQVRSGKRGKSGGIAFADTPDEAGRAAARLLGATLNGETVGELLVEESVSIEAELYAAVVDDSPSKGPLVLFSTAGGMDIEEAGAASPELVRRLPVDILAGLDPRAASAILDGTGLPSVAARQVAEVLAALYRVYRDTDASLAEINPLAVTRSGGVVALDAKVSLDPAALSRHPGIAGQSPPPPTGTALEQRGREEGFHFIELDGDVGVLANGAGLTMTTLDVVSHYGGRPANFLEIGGDSYTRATPALRLVLANPRVRSLLVNFCGAFARTDVMAEGVVAALEELRPDVPVFFTIHGTGEAEAVRLVTDRLGARPYDLMDDAVQAAVAAAAEAA